MDKITDEAREVASRWADDSGMDWIGDRHKLASDIMNYARRVSLGEVPQMKIYGGARTFVETLNGKTVYIDGALISPDLAECQVPVIEFNQLRAAADSYDLAQRGVCIVGAHPSVEMLSKLTAAVGQIVVISSEDSGPELSRISADLRESIEITMLPNLVEPYVEKKTKGHERPYKYHK
ncbi:MAG: hypothetical protein CVU43_12610 [Chloroflexi bacterium HGW-Chloroflexi-5]|nr:MAG: hypothetical protein CVU43_12610 [Chloroflexi bacterium HGW-Chloroflexi-5]